MVSDDGVVALARPDELAGREEELEVLGQRLARASEGAPQVVLVEAEPGLGKSALLEAFVSDAVVRGVGRVTWLRCDESEQDVQYAACEVLLGWPPSEMSGTDVGRRLLSRLRDLPAAVPTLLAIDDAQWLDRSSERALRFAMRRLGDARLLTVLVRRPSTTASAEAWTELPAATTWLRPGPLSSDQIRDLVRRLRSWELTGEVGELLEARTSGLPLFVSALARSATAPTDLAHPAYLPALVVTATLRLLGVVPERVRLLVQSSAVLGAGVPLVVLGQVAGISEVSEAAEQARRAGLFRVGDSGRLCCASPLLQEAVYAAIPLDRRRVLHGRAAACSTGERSLRHRALATDRPDPGLVEELVVAADAARAAYGLQRAADLRMLAREVCGDADLRDELLLEALIDRVASQDLDAARSLASPAEQCPPSALRDLAFGLLARDSGEVRRARLLLERARDAATGAERVGVRDRADLALARLLALLNEGRTTADSAERLLGSEDPELAGAAASLRAHELWWRGELEAALKGLGERPARELATPGEAELLSTRGKLRMYAGRLKDALDDIDASITLAAGRRPPAVESRCYVTRSMVRQLLGRWDAAAADAATARSLAERDPRGWSIPVAHALSALVPAWRGQAALADGHLAGAKEGLARLSTPFVVDYVFRVEVTMASARGDHESVLTLVESRDEAFWERQGRIRAGRGLVQAWVLGCLDTGRIRQAERLVSWYERLLRQWPDGPVPSRLGWMRGRLAELAGDPHAARERYLDDLTDPATALVPFVRAQLLQTWGRLDHSLGYQAEGTARMLEAACVFEQLRAEPSLAACRATMTAWGVRPGVASISRLTAREQDVCTLVLAGRTNREIAAELFLTVKTVEFHLHNVYTKLGIAGRKDLRRGGDAAG